jgi:hypothetical protein
LHLPPTGGDVVSKWAEARAALELDAKQTIIPRSVAQVALADALRKLVPDAEATLYVVCNNLVDPETNEYCEFDGDVRFVDELARCPACGRLMYQTEGEDR